MSEFEQQRRQELLDEDFHYYFQERLTWQIMTLEQDIKQIADPFLEPMVDLYYQQVCLDYSIGRSVEDLVPGMKLVIEFIQATISHVERHNKKKPKDLIDMPMFSRFMETDFLPNLFGMCILFDRQDWFNVVVKAADLSLYDDTERTIDSLIAMKIPGYLITEEKTPRELSFRTPLFKAIHAKTEAAILKNLDDYLRGWYDGLRKAGYSYIDSHLRQQDDSRDCCSFYGYWCFEAAAVAYLKGIDDSSLHHYLYYPKDMVDYARVNKGINDSGMIR